MLASPSPHATSAEELSYCALPNVNKLQLELTLTSACDALLVGHASALLVCARASDVMSADSADAGYPPPANESWWTSPSYFALEAGCSTPVGLPLTRTLAGCFITVQAVRVQVGGIAATYTIQRAPPITVVTAKDEVVARLHYPHGEYAGRNNTVVTAKPPRDWDAYIRPEMVSTAASARPSLTAGTLTSATTLESPGALSNAPTSRVRGAGFELQFPLPLYGSSWVIVDS
ncbi:hypothetical protein EON68_04300 [archaeon]|nr:MAG: hypothetical protein EON68_04300 [archaeon]